jgi:transcriptional regulator with XRE-family HTH domain
MANVMTRSRHVPDADPAGEFGPRLNALRKAAGFTQHELARAAGITRRMVAYYESENNYPPAQVLVQLARALGATTDELLGIGAPPKDLALHGNSHLARRLKQLEALPPSDQKAVFKVIDALATQTKPLTNQGRRAG